MATERLSREKRQDQILLRLRQDSTVRILTLAQQFKVTTETIRRDLDVLSQKGLIERTYGGGARKALTYEPDIWERQRHHISAREKIALNAVTLVEDGDAIMIDSGSTTIRFAENLAMQPLRLKVITNCFSVAAALGINDKIRILFCPGDYLAHEGGVFGVETITFLNRYQVDKAFLGASGLTLEGPTEANPEGAAIKRAMIARAKETYLLLDSSKFEKKQFENICGLSHIRALISESHPSAALATALQGAHIKVHV